MIGSPTTATRILLVEDDEAIASGLSLNLQLEGFTCAVARDGEAALRSIASLLPDLILLDISLPLKSGLEVLAEMRGRGDRTPVIVLSARQDEFDKVAALRSGADDYVTKPFGVAELLARIDAVLRRAPGRASELDTEAAPPFRFGEVVADPTTREVTRGGQPVSLTKLEFELLAFFARNPQRVFSRAALLDHVWGVRHSGSARTVDNFVGQLRAKLETDPTRPRHFVTVRGDGYRFVAD